MSVYLRGWIGLVSLVSSANAVMCFIKKDYPRDRIYNQAYGEATALSARMFGTWTILASVVRLTFAISPFSSGIYIVTLFSFCLALFHFLSEVFVYRTCSLSAGTISPLIVSGLSIGWMIMEYDQTSF